MLIESLMVAIPLICIFFILLSMDKKLKRINLQMEEVMEAQESGKRTSLITSLIGILPSLFNLFGKDEESEKE